MAHRVWWLRSFVVLAALAALGALATHSAVQGGGQDKQLKTNKELEVPWQEHNQKYFPLIRGDKKADKDEMLKVAKAVSGYYVYRLTFVTIKADPKKMATLVEDIRRDLENYVIPSKNPEFQRIYAHELVKCFQKVLVLDVFDADHQPAIFNACALLPTVGKIRTPEVEDFFMRLAKNELAKDVKVHDSVRLSGLKGLAEMPPARVYSILDAGKKDPALDAQKKRDVERIDTLLAFIKRDMPQNVTPDAERFIRRQALRALAQC